MAKIRKRDGESARASEPTSAPDAPPVPAEPAPRVTVPGGGVVREAAPVEPRVHGKGEVDHPTTRVRRAGERTASWTDRALETPPASLQEMEEEPLVIAGKAFGSRLIVGTGKYADPTVMIDSLRARNRP